MGHASIYLQSLVPFLKYLFWVSNIFGIPTETNTTVFTIISTVKQTKFNCLAPLLAEMAYLWTLFIFRLVEMPKMWQRRTALFDKNLIPNGLKTISMFMVAVKLQTTKIKHNITAQRPANSSLNPHCAPCLEDKMWLKCISHRSLAAGSSQPISMLQCNQFKSWLEQIQQYGWKITFLQHNRKQFNCLTAAREGAPITTSLPSCLN